MEFTENTIARMFFGVLYSPVQRERPRHGGWAGADGALHGGGGVKFPLLGFALISLLVFWK
jgi:hypothetical protein